MKLGIYRHYKGKEYKVIGVAKHSETLEDLVVYECLYDNPRSKLWVRPKKMFDEYAEVEGEKVPRFEYIRDDEGEKEVIKAVIGWGMLKIILILLTPLLIVLVFIALTILSK